MIVTHSNHALNDIFKKIINLDIDERHLVRLGYGEKYLKLEKDFSKNGRINYNLHRRLVLLQELEILAQIVGNKISEEFTCETAEIYYNSVIV